MATVTKDFKIKSGLVVEGTTGTINGQDILTKKQGDQDYIIGLIGGSSDSANTPNTVVKRDGSGNFAAGEITADLVGNVTGQVSDISNHNTDDLSEGSSNKYFTDQRAVDANTGLWDTIGAAANAQSAAESYADDVAGQAYANASSYADGVAAQAYSNAQSYADGKSSQAISTAESYADDVAGQAYANATSYTDGAITNLDLSNTYDALGSAANAYSNAISYSSDYTDNAVAALVDSAPALLDTLNELAAAIADNPNYASDIANLISTKADTTYVDNAIANTESYADSAAANAYSNAVSYADSLAPNYDASGAAANAYSNAVSYADSAASNAYSNAVSYADSIAGNYDASGSAANAYANATSYADNAINALTTDDIEEGLTNEYFTDARAKASATNLLVNSNQTNITITEVPGGIQIVAENGVADSTTSDLAEGSNLYFTDSRAIDALNGASISPASVSIDTYRKEEATQQYVGSASQVAVHSFDYPFESAKYLVRVVGWEGGVKHSQLTEILVTTDGNNNVAITEYGMIHTSTNPLATFSAETSGSQVTLLGTTLVNGCEIIAAATMLSWAD